MKPIVLASLLVGLVAACSGKSEDLSDAVAAEPPPPPHGCNNDCEAHLWPRLVVDVFPEPANRKEWDVRMRRDDGSQKVAVLSGCADTKMLQCTFVFPAVREEHVTVYVTPPGQPTLEREVSVAPHNYCGRQIARIRVLMDGVNPPTIGEPTFVSPCSVH